MQIPDNWGQWLTRSRAGLEAVRGRIRSVFEWLWAPERRRISLAAGAALATCCLGLALYAFLHRPGDVSQGAESEFNASEVPNRALESWSIYGLDDARTRYLPTSEVDPPFSVRWRFHARSLLEYSPVMVDGVVYGVSNDGEAFALARDTGAVIWRRKVSRLNASSPTFKDGRLYTVSLEPGSVQALSAETGKTLWRRKLPGRSESSPVIADDLVIFGCENGQLFALDAGTGKTEWKAEIGGAIKGAPARLNETIYVAAYGGILKALRLRDGSEVWSSGSQSGGLTGVGNFYATPTVAFGRVYVGNTDGRMYSFERSSGHLAWSRSTGAYIYSAAVAANTPKTRPTVYFGSYDGRLYALDAKTGRVRWSKPAGGAVSGAGSLIGSTLYISNLRWTSTAGFDPKTGRRKFAFPDGAYNPAISDGKWLILTGKKTIYGLEPKP